MKKTWKKLAVLFVALVMAANLPVFEGDKVFAAGESITAATMNDSTSKKNAAVTISTPGRSEYVVYSIAVKNSGKLYVDASASSSNTYSVSIAVGTYSSSTLSYDRYYSVSPGKVQTGIGGCDVAAGKTYYVGIQSSYAASAQITAYVIPYNTRTLKEGQVMYASGYKGNKADSKACFKIVPSKTGYIKVDLKELGYDNSGGYVTLLNANKKAVSEKLLYDSDSETSYVVFGVKKGKTYYLKVTGCVGSSAYRFAYAITYTNKAATLKNNTSKKKAVKLKRKAKAKSMTRVATGKKQNQWYKFKVTKKRKTQIKVDASLIKSGSATVTVYRGKKKVASTKMYAGKVYTYTVTYSTTYGKANKGTYYVKVATTAKCSGMYKIRYLK